MAELADARDLGLHIIIKAGNHHNFALLKAEALVSAWKNEGESGGMADARDLGSRGEPWGFKSPLSHQTITGQPTTVRQPAQGFLHSKGTPQL